MCLEELSEVRSDVEFDCFFKVILPSPYKGISRPLFNLIFELRDKDIFRMIVLKFF